MTTSRRTIARPLRSSTVRCPSGPTLTKAVDKVRRPWASAGESARRVGAGFSAADTGSGSDPWAACARSPAPRPAGLGAAEPGPSVLVSRDSRAAVSGTGLGLRIVASLGGGLQAASAAMHGGKRQGITPFVSLNTAFATGAAPSSHWAGASALAATERAPKRRCDKNLRRRSVRSPAHRRQAPNFFVKYQLPLGGQNERAA
jgi:hypothetical protein